MSHLPARQQAAHYEAWLHRALERHAPGETAWARAHGAYSPEWTLGRLVRGAKSASAEVSAHGVGRLLAEVAAVVVLDTALLSHDAHDSFADLVWRPDPNAGFPPPQLVGAIVGLTPSQLVLVGIGKTTHPRTFDVHEMPLWTVGYTTAQLAAARVQMVAVPLLPYLSRLTIGQGDHAFRFEIAASAYFEDNAAQGKTIRERLATIR